MKRIILMTITILLVISAFFWSMMKNERAGIIPSVYEIKRVVTDILPVPVEKPTTEIDEKTEVLPFEGKIEINVIEQTDAPEVKLFVEPAGKTEKKPLEPEMQLAVIDALPVPVEKPAAEALKMKIIPLEQEQEIAAIEALADPEEKPSVEAAEKAGAISSEQEIEVSLTVALLVPAEKPTVESTQQTGILLSQQEGEKTATEIKPDLAEKPAGNLNKRVALLPFDNFSDDENALTHIMPELKKRLFAKGMVIINEDRLNDFLCDEKVRSTGYISNEITRKVRDSFRVGTILAGSVISYVSEKNLYIGLMARLIDSTTGYIIWADYVSVSGHDFTGILGLGKIKTINKLIPKALDKLLVSFNTMPDRIDSELTHKIAVLPFLNKSKSRNAGIITMYMFLVELLKNHKFQPIEYGEVRKFIVDSRIRNRGELEYEKLEAFSKTLGTEGVLVGTVEQYSGGLDESLPTKVAVTARLLDARKNKILWYNTLQMDGEKNIVVFDWGRIRSVDFVAYNVIHELVSEMENIKWQ